MTRDEAITLLREHADDLRAQGVTRLSLFGSTARGAARPDSDVDVLVDVDPSRPFSVMDLSRLRLFLCDLFGRDADVLIDRPDLRPALHAEIAEDAVQVFPPDPGAAPPRTATHGERARRMERLERQRLLDRLGHIREAAAAIQEYVAGKSPDRFMAERLLRSAVEREISVISEASRPLPEALKARFPSVDWRGVAGIGNVLRHDYDGIDYRRLWEIATTDVAPLEAAVLAMIAEIEGEAGG